MEYIVGLAIIIAIAYWVKKNVFKAEEKVTEVIAVADVPAVVTTEPVQEEPAKPAKKKPAVKKATTRAPKTAAAKKPAANKKTAK